MPVNQGFFEIINHFINKTAPITGLCIYPVDREFYDQITVEDTEKQLRIIVGYVYAREAMGSAAKATFKACLKKLLKKSGEFTDSDLAFL